MRSKLYPQERKTCSSKCNTPRSFTCNNMKECDTFTSHVTKETFKINHHFNCNSKCLVYVFSCKVYEKKYVGSTTDKFSYRWNNYKNCQRKAERGEDHMQKYLHEHFLMKIMMVFWIMLRLLCLIRLIHQTLKEERNFGALSCVH